MSRNAGEAGLSPAQGREAPEDTFGAPAPIPTLMPLGDRGLLIRFGEVLTDAANRAAIAFARRAGEARIAGVTEMAPNLVSVLVCYDPRATGFAALAGELRLLLVPGLQAPTPPAEHRIAVVFGGEEGPDLDAVAAALGMSADAFVAAHNGAPLRVLATGFAPGFVYCGLHGRFEPVPRRKQVRPSVPAGSVLFAAGQTAIASTPLPTGWHVIGRTDFRNFDPAADPPTRLRPSDRVSFAAVAR